MKRVLWILAAAGACLVAAAALLAGQDTDKAGEGAARKSAEEAANNWLALVDSSRYGESWNQAGALFKKHVSAEEWEKTARSVREPFGKLLSRKVKHADYSRSLPGAPDGEFVILVYESSFENKKEAGETV